MVQRNALILAAGITAFVLVLVGGIAATIVQAANAPAAAAPAAVTAPAVQAPGAQPAQPTSAPAKPVYALSAEQAGTIALEATPGSKLAGTPGLVSFEGTPAYEVTLDLGKVYVDANSGRVLYNGAIAAQSPNNNANGATAGTGGPVTSDQAVQIARSYLGGGNVVAMQTAQQDGMNYYAIQFDNGTVVVVSADTGQIVEVQQGQPGGGREHEHEQNEGNEGHEG